MRVCVCACARTCVCTRVCVWPCVCVCVYTCVCVCACVLRVALGVRGMVRAERPCALLVLYVCSTGAAQALVSVPLASPHAFCQLADADVLCDEQMTNIEDLEARELSTGSKCMLGQRTMQSRRRCGAGVSQVPLQMWQG